jgi:hypothetical protein
MIRSNISIDKTEVHTSQSTENFRLEWQSVKSYKSIKVMDAVKFASKPTLKTERGDDGPNLFQLRSLDYFMVSFNLQSPPINTL